MSNYLDIANSPVMAILCGIAIIFVLLQCVVFFTVAKKRATEIGITNAEIKKIVKSSAIFSIVPSLPIIISYMVLIPALGKFFPWLRLSVIGSASYETMAANMAVTAYGFEGLGTSNFTPEVFGAIMWVVTLGMMISSLSVLILKKYDSKMKIITGNKNGFGVMVAPTMFLGMMATFAAPYIVNVKNPVSMITLIVSSLSVFLLDRISKKVKALQEFAFSLSMLIGMASACIATVIIG